MVTRISGLASGMDVDTIVKGLMDAQRVPLDKLNQKKTYTEWQRDDYRTINTALSELDTLISDGVGREASFIKKTVSVSNPDAVSVKNINSTSDFSGTVNVGNVATASTIFSNSSTKIKKSSDKLSTYGITTGNFTITAMNKTGTMEEKPVSITTDDTMDSLIQKINSQTNVNAFFDQVTQKISFAAKYTGTDSSSKGITLGGKFFSEIFSSTVEPGQVTAGALTFDFAKAGATLNGYKIEFGTVVDGTTASASIDETNKKIMINGDFDNRDSLGTYSSTLNIKTAIEAAFTAKGGSFAGITATVGGTPGTETTGTASAAISGGVSNFQSTVGVNANVEYNGMPITRTSNIFTINGAEITLKKATADSVTFSSSADVDTIYNMIKSFVDSYNGLIANISDKISEKKNADYPPLTDAQKKDMKDTDITIWEAKAKKGTLHNDSTLSSLLTKMRTSIYPSVNGTSFGDLSKIGIATTSTYQDGGKLKIDEVKLRAAISEDSNGIYNLFMADGEKTADGKYTSLSEQGVARRLRDNLKSAMTDISTKAGKTSSVNKTFTLGRLLNDYTTQITSFNDRLTSLETRYYKQFTAMEKAIQNANSQSASLSSYLGK